MNAPPVAETTVDGLERRQAKQVDTLYVLPGMSLAPYKQVMLDSVELAFKPDWQKRNPEVTESDITRIRSQGAGVFYEIFSAALTRQHGYPITTQPGPDVLRISATISELDFATTPGTAGAQHMHLVSPADMTLLMELRDSQSGALLVRAVDKEKGRMSGNLTSRMPCRIPPKHVAHSKCGLACCVRRSMQPAARRRLREQTRLEAFNYSAEGT